MIITRAIQNKASELSQGSRLNAILITGTPLPLGSAGTLPVYENVNNYQHF
jgi:hypothetical protein